MLPEDVKDWHAKNDRAMLVIEVVGWIVGGCAVVYMVAVAVLALA